MTLLIVDYDDHPIDENVDDDQHLLSGFQGSRFGPQANILAKTRQMPWVRKKCKLLYDLMALQWDIMKCNVVPIYTIQNNAISEKKQVYSPCQKNMMVVTRCTEPKVTQIITQCNAIKSQVPSWLFSANVIYYNLIQYKYTGGKSQINTLLKNIQIVKMQICKQIANG